MRIPFRSHGHTQGPRASGFTPGPQMALATEYRKSPGQCVAACPSPLDHPDRSRPVRVSDLDPVRRPARPRRNCPATRPTKRDYRSSFNSGRREMHARHYATVTMRLSLPALPQRARWCYAASGRANPSQCPVKLASGATAGTVRSVPAVGPSMKNPKRTWLGGDTCCGPTDRRNLHRHRTVTR